MLRREEGGKNIALRGLLAYISGKHASFIFCCRKCHEHVKLAFDRCCCLTQQARGDEANIWGKGEKRNIVPRSHSIPFIFPPPSSSLSLVSPPPVNSFHACKLLSVVFITPFRHLPLSFSLAAPSSPISPSLSTSSANGERVCV